MIDETLTKAVIDTGSMITSISNSLYNKLKPKPYLFPIEDFKLNILAANGQTIPYLGYIEAEIKVPFLKDKSFNIPILVLRDYENSQDQAIIGTNFIKLCKFETTTSQCTLPAQWETAFSALTDNVGIVKSTRRIKLKPEEIRTITGFVRKIRSVDSCVTEVTEENHSTAKVNICPRVVSLNKPGENARIPLRIVNMSKQTVIIPWKATLCELKEVKVIRDAFDVKETQHTANYGQIHVCVRELVQEKFGDDIWLQVLKASELDEHDHFLVFHRYGDDMTFKLIGAVCSTLNVELPAVLEIFGEFFLKYCLRHGYDKMLKTLGADFKSFIQNLDSLHSLLALTYKDIEAPSFRCENNDDGSLALHYYTIRPGLYPIVIGLIRAVARDLYNQDSEVEVVNKSLAKIEGGKSQEHVQFKVILNDKKNEQKPSKSVAEFKPAFPKNFMISAEQFCNAFPYHLIFDRNLRIKQCGMMIQRLLCIPLNGKHIGDIFELIHPRMEMLLVNLRMFINAVFMLKVVLSNSKKRNIGQNGASLILKGQMMWLDDIQHMIFISSPRLSSLTELMEMNVYLADIPLYDVTRELVLLNQQRIAEIDIAKKLDETTIALRKTSQALEEEKKKTETLLYQMLPEKVAESLKNGKNVAAEKFEQVTILFSDIVTFTNIAAACPAMSVVDMLNDMYHRFDAATTLHGVYKVETIGDAYMVVCGVPLKTTTHAKPVADFALDMIREASQVKSPATGKPLQIRVGIHTGPVVAGVVGKKMPRYCLFGDTVNTASRMESHGVPGRIHVSPTTYDHLHREKQYNFRCRGELEVKGKGKMSTFFLMGTTTNHLEEPDDGFGDLPISGPDDKLKDIRYPKVSRQMPTEPMTTSTTVTTGSTKTSTSVVVKKSGTCIVL